MTITREGTLQVAFTWMGMHCRERVKLKATRSNIAYAARLREAIIHDIERGTFRYGDHFPNSPRAAMQGHQRIPTVSQALDQYLAYCERAVAHSTYKGYASAVEHHLRPEFGALLLTDLTVARIKAWLGRLTISAKRTNNVLIPLRAITADAHSDGLIPADPLKRIPSATDRRPPPTPDPFTRDEVDALLAACRDPAFRAFIAFAVGTGMRTSELMAVRWESVDWERGTVRVERAFVEGRHQEVTKTKAGRRDILLMPMALEALQAMRPITQAAQPEIFIYPHAGRPWDGYDEIRKSWHPVIRRAGIRYRPQYQTRHTYASWLLSAGENPVWVAKQMGHRDWGMIQRVYGDWIDSAAPDAGQKGRAVFGGKDSRGGADEGTGIAG